MAGMNGQGMGSVGGGGGSATQGGTTGATTNAVVKATGANTLGDTNLTESSGVLTGTSDIAPGITAGAVSSGTTGKNVSLTASAAKASSAADGGNVVLTTGAGDGAGIDGFVKFATPSSANGMYISSYQDNANTIAWWFNKVPNSTNLDFYTNSTIMSFYHDSIYLSRTNLTALAHADTANNRFRLASNAAFQFALGVDAGSDAGDTGLKRDSAAVVAVTDGSTGQGALLTKRVVTAKTADYTVTAAETGAVFTNTGASGTVVFTLPASPSNGLTYEFHITEAQSVDIQTGTAVLIYANAAATTATTGKLTKNTVGTCIQLVYNGVAWMGVGQSGTWTVS